jgi:hypothetical protein
MKWRRISMPEKDLPEQILESYKTLGFKPRRAPYLRADDENNIMCCGLTAYVLGQKPELLGEFLKADENNRYSDYEHQIDIFHTFIRPNLPADFRRHDFEAGFDTRPDSESYLRKQYNITERPLYYELGHRTAELVFDWWKNREEAEGESP